MFRAWGLMWSINILLALPQFLNTLIRSPYGLDQKATERFFLSSQAIALGCQIAVAILLIQKASWLATIVFPAEAGVQIALDAEGFRAVLFAVVGLYFLVDGFRYAVGNGYELLARPRGSDQMAAAYLWQKAPESFARAVGGLLAGAIILFGGRKPWQLAKGLYERIFGLKGSPSE